jgi:amino acid transporter
MQFKREISLFGLFLVGVGSIIGSGWLFGPLYTAQIAGPAAVLSWLLGGLLMTIITLTFAELGSAFPVAGSMVQVAQHSHGPLVGFMIGWLVWVSNIAVAPVETMAIMQYAGNYIPGLVTKLDNATVLTRWGFGASAGVLFLMTILNYYGARFFSKTNNAITTFKLIMPIATFILLMIIDFHSSNFHSTATGGFAPYGWHGILAALPLGGVVFSLLGANTVLHLAAETKNPQRYIPLALVGSIVICTLLYALLQFSFIGAVNPAAIAGGWSKIHFPGDSGPFAGILTALGLTWFVVLLYADAVISPFGTGFIFMGATARVNFGLSKIGFFPKRLQTLNKRGAPIVALVVNYFISLLLFLPFPGWQSLVGFVISCFILSYIIGPIALIVLRKTQPEYHRPFRLPWASFISFVAFYGCNLLVFWTGWETVYKMMITMLIGFLFFIVYSVKEKNNVLASQIRISWWVFPYLIGMAIISYFGTFGGGKNTIPFGWDFAVIAVFSFIIFVLAIKLSRSSSVEI